MVTHDGRSLAYPSHGARPPAGPPRSRVLAFHPTPPKRGSAHGTAVTEPPAAGPPHAPRHVGARCAVAARARGRDVDAARGLLGDAARRGLPPRPARDGPPAPAAHGLARGGA